MNTLATAAPKDRDVNLLINQFMSFSKSHKNLPILDGKMIHMQVVSAGMVETYRIVTVGLLDPD